MNEKSHELLQEIESLSKLTRTGLHKKVQTFIKLYERETTHYRTIMLYGEKQNSRLTQLKNQLDHLNASLEERVAQEVAARQEKEKMLEQQAKMAAMGEMMDAVAHQWKQPLNALSMLSDLLLSDYLEGSVDNAYITSFHQDTHEQIEHLLSTLATFRAFFRPNKGAEPFGAKRSIQSVMLLVKDEFLQHGITIDLNIDKEVIIEGIENEFKHLILNIINNAKDAFIENGINKRQITITFIHENHDFIIKLCDNAGGIPENILQEIFKPNVTSKAEGKGTGIGLYMSSQIAQKLGGTLQAINENDGACFLLTMPKR